MYSRLYAALLIATLVASGSAFRQGKFLVDDLDTYRAYCFFLTEALTHQFASQDNSASLSGFSSLRSLPELLACACARARIRDHMFAFTSLLKGSMTRAATPLTVIHVCRQAAHVGEYASSCWTPSDGS